jgi:hypothetical protein
VHCTISCSRRALSHIIITAVGLRCLLASHIHAEAARFTSRSEERQLATVLAM